ncbi:MAG: 4Fe-4S binding protein [Pirellulales bacterium]
MSRLTRAIRWMLLGAALAALFAPRAALAAEPIPSPEFKSGYRFPEVIVPAPRADVYAWIDVAALAVALSLASYLALVRRSRRGLLILALVSLGYFGFWRHGCVCSIGSLQNVTLSLFYPGYVLPATVAAFFLLPLVFTLFFGRTFCAAVCPLGAIQEAVVLRPVMVPSWLEHVLGLLAYVYLGAAVIFAALGAAVDPATGAVTGSVFAICRYDPFVGFFRLSTASIYMLVLGVAFLLLGLFVGRPYCRFLCPYGAILRLLSKASKWHVSVPPEQCIQCRLCEEACPYGAIQMSTPEQPARDRGPGKRRLAILLVVLPLLVVGGGWVGRSLGVPMSKTHATVQLAERVWQEDQRLVTGRTEASAAFRNTSRPAEQLFDEALDLQKRFTLAGLALGAWVGLVLGVKLIHLSIHRRRTEYEADRTGCVSCGRCFEYCPHEQARLEQIAGLGSKE